MRGDDDFVIFWPDFSVGGSWRTAIRQIVPIGSIIDSAFGPSRLRQFEQEETEGAILRYLCSLLFVQAPRASCRLAMQHAVASVLDHLDSYPDALKTFMTERFQLWPDEAWHASPTE